ACAGAGDSAAAALAPAPPLAPPQPAIASTNATRTHVIPRIRPLRLPPLPPTRSRVDSPAEVLPGLVPGSVFKTDGGPRERRHGGFDSRALPPPPRAVRVRSMARRGRSRLRRRGAR